MFPYQSIGRLYFKHDQSGDDYEYGSDYFAKLQERNMNTIITAAYNLWDEGCGVSRDFKVHP